jgi:glycosyltransferase involved in cell wall biosynthesis
MTAAPTVSVIIPAFNAAAFVGEAIESALAQTHRPAQIVVVDDGSTDGTADVVRGFRAQVELVQRTNGGISAARNSALGRCSGTHIAFLDADDTWEPRKLERQLAAMAETSADLAFCLAVNFRRLSDGTIDTSEVLHGHAPSATLVTREGSDRVGLFNESLRVGEFLDWLARAREARLREVEVEEVLFRRRVHATNHGILQSANRVDYTRALRASLQRRRALDPDA